MGKENKLYWQLSDGRDVSGLIMDLDGCFEWIRADILESLSNFEEPKDYLMEPIWLTEEEFHNLPEADI